MTTFRLPEELLAAGVEYVKWCKDNPHIIKKTGLSKGIAVKYEEEQERAPTIVGFAHHLGVSPTTVTRWFHADDPDFHDAANRVKAMIQSDQQYGAIAGFYNPMIIGRLQGLAEKVETQELTPPPPNELDKVNKVHPDAPLADQFSENPLLFSQRQLDAGVPYPAK